MVNMANRHLGLKWYHWIIVILWGLTNWFTNPAWTSFWGMIGALLGSLVGAYVIIYVLSRAGESIFGKEDKEVADTETAD